MTRRTEHNRLRAAINREGILFVFFLCALGAAAVYSGLAGLMILFCALTASAVLLCVLGRRNMQPLKIVRRFSQDIYAGRETSVEVFVTNCGKTASFGLHVYEMFGPNRCIGPIFIGRLEPGETAAARYTCIFDVRGVARFSAFEARSRFPAPLAEWRQTVGAPDAAYVYPRIDEGCDLIEFDGGAPDMPAPSGAAAQNRELRSISELRNGRRRGRILWKLSAKKGKIYEDVAAPGRQKAATPQICVGAQNGFPRALHERRIAQVATFCAKRARSGGCGTVRLLNDVYRYGQSPEQLRNLLNALASFDAELPQAATQNKAIKE